ncbi:WHG domain-containing protein [bacterium]|nr:WHG domain-containing protein [bacterium]
MSRPAKFTRLELLETAREIANREGWDHLTLNRLADELDIKPPSLYNHVQGVEGLRKALAVHAQTLLTRELERAAIGKAGADAFRAIGIAYRAFALGNPGLLHAMATAPDRSDELQRMTDDRILEIGMAVLKGFGLEGQEAIHALRTLRSLAHGFAVLELDAGFGRPEQVTKSFDWALNLLVAGLERK